MCHCLKKSFWNYTDSLYNIVEIDEESLKTAWQGKTFSTIDGSSRFQILIFMPNISTFQAAPYICNCKHCLENYGSCKLFNPFQMTTGSLCSEMLDQFTTPEDDFLSQGTIVAITAKQNTGQCIS